MSPPLFIARRREQVEKLKKKKKRKQFAILMQDENDDDDNDAQMWFAQMMGMLASLLFTLQYVPQLRLNWRRRSTKGLSGTAIVIKEAGASFLLANAWLGDESAAVVLYGLFNVLQHSVFLIQLSVYADRAQASLYYLPWLLFPLAPMLLGSLAPSTMALTSAIKPLTQLISHFPQLVECCRVRSTRGMSMLTQHLNAAGGFAGLYMCMAIEPNSPTIYFLYVNSIFQAFSIYTLCIFFDGARRLFLFDEAASSSTSRLPK
jgi:uncharacterized protein with PQ loop repeat